MTLLSNFNTLVEKLNNELNSLDNELSQAIKLVRAIITLFPNNIVSVQIFFRELAMNIDPLNETELTEILQIAQGSRGGNKN